MDDNNNSPKSTIHQSEMDFISRCVRDYPNLETGGDFFGLWTRQGNPVVLYVTGPGKGTSRSETSFYQDIEYLREGGALLNREYGLEHIGAWHSHHQLSLNHPSSGDVNTMRNALRDRNLPRFLISICNINNNSKVSISGFLFSNAYSNDYIPCAWKVLEGSSPIRESISKYHSNFFIMPQSSNVPLKTSEREIEYHTEKRSNVEKPNLANNSYWVKKEGQEYLKMVFEKLKKREDLYGVELLQLSDQRIAISFKHNGGFYEIRFPNDFPEDSPEVIEKIPIDDDGIIPETIKRIFHPTKKREDNIRKFIRSLDILDRNTNVVVRFS